MTSCTSGLDVPASVTQDPVGLLRFLDASGRFHRDNGLGGMMHPGKHSYRESVTHDSLHILIDGNQVSAHVDRYSPLRLDPGGTTRYSIVRAFVHNLAHIGEEVLRVLTGRRGEHRCVLDCQRTEVDARTLDALLHNPGPERSVSGEDGR